MKFETGPFSYYGVMALSTSSLEFRSPSHGGNLNRSASLSCTERAQESSSIGGSNTQIPGTPFQYIPDFSVRALADLQFVMVTRAHYQNALLASRLDSTPQSPEGSHTRLDTSVSLPPFTQVGAHTLPPLATPPARHPSSNTQSTPQSGRASFTIGTSSSSRRPSQSVPQLNPSLNSHSSLSQTSPSSVSTVLCPINPPLTSVPSKSQRSSPSESPENGPEETTTLLSEQQNCVGPRQPSHTQPPPQGHSVSHAHTESTI
ncbi:metal transporter CNNM1 [Nematolebias whitei]|uniref:metal transporter CNNM1 n=1 Tax=Nematolebias whitei TaxID=451745 RepID=UPI00189A9269|nr:metal transporter CNNM1 [Nematolebias whitei]